MEVLIYAIILFIVIYLAVRIAIIPLLPKQMARDTNKTENELIGLRDIGILTNTELEKVIELYNNKGLEKDSYQQYVKNQKVVKQLKEIGYFTEEEYITRISNLKKYFNV